MSNYAIKAVFLSNDEGDPQYTYYTEVTFDTEEEAMDALNGDYGDTLSEAATIDTQSDPDLDNYYLDDLTVYQIGE